MRVKQQVNLQCKDEDWHDDFKSSTIIITVRNSCLSSCEKSSWFLKQIIYIRLQRWVSIEWISIENLQIAKNSNKVVEQSLAALEKKAVSLFELFSAFFLELSFNRIYSSSRCLASLINLERKVTWESNGQSFFSFFVAQTHW